MTPEQKAREIIEAYLGDKDLPTATIYPAGWESLIERIAQAIREAQVTPPTEDEIERKLKRARGVLYRALNALNDILPDKINNIGQSIWIDEVDFEDGKEVIKLIQLTLKEIDYEKWGRNEFRRK